MFDITITDASLLKDGLVQLRLQYTNPDWVALIGKEAATEMLDKIESMMNKLTGLGYATDARSIKENAVTGYVITQEEHDKLFTGTKKKHNINCRCGAQYFTALNKSVCPECNSWYEIMEKPDGV